MRSSAFAPCPSPVAVEESSISSSSRMRFGSRGDNMAAMKSDDIKYARMEGASDTLYPGASTSDNVLRLGFIRKVYGILAMQMAVTAAVAGYVVLTPGVAQWISATPGMLVLATFSPIITLMPLFCYRHSHPLNLVLLGVWTLGMSITVGVVTAQFSGDIIFQALVITTGVVTSLTAYTFVGVKKGQDFGFLGPMLFASLMTLFISGLVFSLFAVGDFTRFVFAVAGAGVFSTYIVYDTNELILRHSVDEYVWATVGLYLDIINLFLRMLEILQYLNNRN